MRYARIMQRTTVVLPDELMAELRHEARHRDSSIAEVVRIAVERELRSEKPKRRLEFIGIGSSGDAHLSESVDEHLAEIYEGRARRSGQ